MFLRLPSQSPIATSESAQVVSDGKGDGGYLIEGSCIYSEAGNYVIPVTIYSNNDLFGTVYATVSVSDAALAVTPATGLQEGENAPFQSVTVATFTDADSYSSPDDFIALITWEPGHTTAGTVTYDSASQQYSVCGDYTYGQAASKTVQVQLLDAGGNQATTSTALQVTDPYTLTLTPAPLQLDDLNSGDMEQMAQLSDTDTAAISSDFTGTMTWGSSSCDCTVVPADGGGFDVYASTSTPFAGSNQPITVAANDGGGASASVNDDELQLDSGSTVSLAGLPTNSDLTITNGTTLDPEGNSIDLGSGSITVDCGGIIHGSIAATSYSLDDASISANLTGGSLTASDFVFLSGTDSLSGTVTVCTANDTLEMAGLLACSQTVTNNGTLEVDQGGTLNAASVMNTASLSNSGTLVVGAGNELDNDGGTLANYGELDVYGTVNNGDEATGTLTNYGSVAVYAGGTLANTAGSELDNEALLNNDGTLSGAVDGGGVVTAGFVLNGGGTVSAMALPAGANLTITNGTTLNVDGDATLGTLVLSDGGCLSAGQVTATAGTLSDGFLDCGLSGGPITVSGISTLYGTNGEGDSIAITAGSTLYVGDGGLADSSVSNGGVLAFNPIDNQTFSGAIMGTGVVQVMGPATEVFTGTISSGCAGVQIDGGMAEFASVAALPGSGLITINTGGALEAAGAYTTVADWLDESPIDPSSTGALALAADSSENIDLRCFGPLSLGAAANVNYTGTITPYDETYQLGGGPGTLTVASTLTDDGGTPRGVAINGNVVLAGANLSTNGTLINAGVLGVASDSALGDGSITFNAAGALQALGSFTCSQSIVTPNGAGQVATIDANGWAVELAGSISGVDGLCLTDSTGGGVVCFSGDNLFQGNVEITGGMAQFETADSLPTTAVILIDSGGVLEATGAYSTAAEWLNNDDSAGRTIIDPNSTGTLALIADEDSITMTGYDLLSLGAVGNVTFDGTLTAASDTYGTVK